MHTIRTMVEIRRTDSPTAILLQFTTTANSEHTSASTTQTGGSWTQNDQLLATTLSNTIRAALTSHYAGANTQ